MNGTKSYTSLQFHNTSTDIKFWALLSLYSCFLSAGWILFEWEKYLLIFKFLKTIYWKFPFYFLSIYFYWYYCYLSCIIFVIKIACWPTCLLWTLWYSLSQLVRWMGVKAEELGVEIYPGFAASEVLLLIFSWVSQLAVDSFLFARMFGGILY